MIKLGVAQIKNSTDIEENFVSIQKSLQLFEQTEVDLIIFPECSLSGFSAKIRDCTLELITEHLNSIESWSKKNKKYVILPTALKENNIYNTGFIFGGEKVERFYKLGLTDSEKGFFSLPKEKTKKVFKIKSYNIAILICFEAQISPWEFFEKGEADLILWPGYWGWEEHDTWEKHKKNDELNLIFQNMEEWKKPLIQANFAFNDLSDHRGSGPHGLSMFVNSDNTLFAQGDFDSESCYQIVVEDNRIKDCIKLGLL